LGGKKKNGEKLKKLSLFEKGQEKKILLSASSFLFWFLSFNNFLFLFCSFFLCHFLKKHIILRILANSRPTICKKFYCGFQSSEKI